MIVEDFLRYMLAEREASPRTVKTYQDALSDYVTYLKKVDDDMNLEDADSDIIRSWVEDMMDRGHKATYTSPRYVRRWCLHPAPVRHGRST